MIVWVDKSDSGTRFFEGDSSEVSIPTHVALNSILHVLQDRILGHGNADHFNVLMLEVNCDTGRLIAGASTEKGWERGRTDGCSVRVQEIQDYWYDLLDASMDDAQWASALRQRVLEIGTSFKSLVDASLEAIRSNAGDRGFRLVVFGSTPGDTVMTQIYR
jgi:hypothetical protein